MIQFLQDDVFGVMVKPGEERIIRGKGGDIILMPTSVYHFGCSHFDFCGQDTSAFRRRIFSYWDVHPAVMDVHGDVVDESSIPIPDNYHCKIIDNVPSLEAAYLIITHEAKFGREMLNVTST